MDLDGEWEFVIPTNSFNSNTKDLSSSFIGTDLFVEADYFKCPQNTTLLTTHHHHYHQQKHEEQEEEQLPDLPVEQVEEEEEEKEEEPVVEQEEEEEEPPSPYREAPVLTPPFNWLEPDPVVFDRSPDRYHKEQVMPMGEDDKDFVPSGFSLWRLGVHGIGAICSFGVATAATLCVFALGTASTSGRLRPSPNIQFQIYSDDHKRIKEVVQRATGLNHAISAARGITIPRAQITFGGHYEGL
ncbi:hypothetical protein FCM35_KLT13204 [Carex littledalei]|uniref:DUF6821 domain-containing protein n=1 Tax=Carex littledalei TaxID=544730 RepID=A0A833VG38_9POAL|nr:hypothetical protein FCM35_KLT13204 [Carex littledalei]